MVKTPTLLIRLAAQVPVEHHRHPVRPLARLVHRPHLAAALHQMPILQRQLRLVQRLQETVSTTIPILLR